MNSPPVQTMTRQPQVTGDVDSIIRDEWKGKQVIYENNLI